MKNLIAFDFSISKPAACVLADNQHFFYCWPKNMSENHKELFEYANVKIYQRTTIEIEDKPRYDVMNSIVLSKLIVSSLSNYLNEKTVIGFEGTSYGSTGNVTISLVAWRYMLMRELSQIVPLKNMFTYSPITVKSIAGCAKKGMGKPDMIRAFMMSDIKSDFQTILRNNTEKFMKKGGKNYIDHVDDLVDAFWVLQTTIIKEKLI
jgi:CRISPR/Cas system endoribonuclease Cas6 (RAMP superfamily)